MVLVTHERCALKKKHCRLAWTDETCAWQQELAPMHCIWASFSGRFFTAITARLRPMTILGPEWFIPGITQRDSMPLASIRKTFGHHQPIFNRFSRIIITIHGDIQIPYKVAPPSCKLLYNSNELLILPTILHRFHPAICIKLARGKTYLDLCFNPKPGVWISICLFISGSATPTILETFPFLWVKNQS